MCKEKSMSEENNNSPLNLKVQLNSKVILGNYQIELQKLLNIFNFSNSTAIMQNENSYQYIKPFLDISPAKNLKLSFEEIKSAFIIWNITNIMRNSIECVSNFLEEVYIYCTIIVISKKNNLTVNEWNETLSNGKVSFNRLGLPDKIEYLKNNYDVYSNFDEYIVSINKARNCLVHRKGIVSERDIDINQKLEVKWNTFKIKTTSPDGKKTKIVNKNNMVLKGWSLEVWLEEKSKTFNQGDKITFAQEEISDTIMTLIQYGSYLHQSMLAYYSKEKK